MIDYTRELSKKYTENRSKYILDKKDLFDALDQVGIEGKDILDFGCGDAIYSVKFAKMGARTITGIDSSEFMINLGRERVEKENITNINLLQMDGNKLTFDDSSFDFVFSNFVLHYFAETFEPLSESYRVLRKGGNSIIVTETFELSDGYEYLKNTEVPLRLGPVEGYTSIRILVKDKQENEDKINKIGYKIIMSKNDPNINAKVDPDYEYADKVKMITTIYILEK